MEGLTYGGKFAFQNRLYRLILEGFFVLSKSIGLSYSWKEIYVSNLQKVFTKTRREGVDLTKTQPCKYFIWNEKSKPRVKSELRKQRFRVTLFGCN